LHTPKRRSTMDQFIFQRRTPATEEESTGPSVQPQDAAFTNIVRESPSPADAKTGADADITHSGGRAGSDPGKTHESRPPPEQEFMDEDQAGPDPGESLAALAGQNPESTHDDFMANLYPNRRTPATEEESTGPSVQPQDAAFTNIVRESPSPADAKTGADADITHSGGDTEIL
nr:hypothetical protein [Tanacetum cinerariifolium]